jgi:hypothetical protein
MGDPFASETDQMTRRQFAYQHIVRSYEISPQSRDVAVDQEERGAPIAGAFGLFDILARGHEKNIHSPVHQGADFLALNLGIFFRR